MGAVSKFATAGIAPAERLRYWNSIADEAFCKDTVMIESQQWMIDQHFGKQMGWINADRGLSLFRFVLERLMTEEKTVRGDGSPSAAA